MTGLFLHTGNRLEILAKHLAESLVLPGRDPLRPDMVIVQSRGMERWLTGELCRYNRIVANVQFPFPNHLVDQILTAAAIDGRGEHFTRDVLLFRLLGLITQLIDEPQFAPLARYLGNEPSAVKRLQLCQTIAQTFDSYTLYRPDLIASWEQGDGDDWQPHLWRRLQEDLRETHRGALYRQAVDAILSPDFHLSMLPERIFAFGISSLPPSQLQLFRALATRIPVSVYLLNPCREYWSDLVAPKRKAALQEGEGGYWESGNPLLSSLGRKGQEFLGQFESFEELQLNDWSIEPASSSILGRIQHDILTLESPEISGVLPVSADDRSVQIHACHSPMREIEVLHDQLLGLLAENPDLEPADILVMTPEIETYAPCIEAVFGSLPAEDRRRIPYSIADRSPASEGAVGKALLALLSFCSGRFTLSGLFDLLEHPVIRQKFNFAEDELESGRELCHRAGVRWGIDADHRVGLGLPGFSDYSWQAGLDRLLLSWAMPEGDDLVAGILPLEGISREQADRAGRIAEVIAACRDLRDLLQQPATIPEWQQRLEGVIERFCHIRPAEEGEKILVSNILHRMTQNAELAGFTDPVELELVLPWVEKTFGSAASSHGFLSGGVTFCALLPLRSIPFKVIALIGMNDREFPRRDQRPSFDLMQAHRRAGDPNRREEDRYLFLEALLSARENLLISYVGQSMTDNAEIPPSVVVSELLDYLMARFGEVARNLVTSHRLQPFSPAYFQGSGTLFSFAAEQARGAMARHRRLPEAPFVSGTFPLTEELVVRPQELIRFFSDPASWFLTNRLGMALEDHEEEDFDLEPFGLDGLGRYQLREQLLKRRLAGIEGDDSWCSATHLLPPGQLGSNLLSQANVEIEPILDNFGDLLRRQRSEEIPVDITHDMIRVQGSIQGTIDQRQLVLKPGKLRAKDLLRGWILHLLTSYARPGENIRTLLIGTEFPAKEFVPIEHPREHLEVLLGYLQQGAQNPLPFFPQSAHAYAEALFSEKGEEKALSAARSKWGGGYNIPGECEGKGVVLCFGAVDPLNEQSLSVASSMFNPLFSHLEDGHE